MILPFSFFVRRNFAREDADAYTAELAVRGNVLDSDRHRHLVSLASRIYQIAGRCDFYIDLAAYNIGSGSKVLTFHREEDTLTGDVVWGADGLHFNASGVSGGGILQSRVVVTDSTSIITLCRRNAATTITPLGQNWNVNTRIIRMHLLNDNRSRWVYGVTNHDAPTGNYNDFRVAGWSWSPNTIYTYDEGSQVGAMAITGAPLVAPVPPFESWRNLMVNGAQGSLATTAIMHRSFLLWVHRTLDAEQNAAIRSALAQSPIFPHYGP